VDMSVFPSSKHLCSWAGLTPQNQESAGKKKTTRIGRGGRYIVDVLFFSQIPAALSKRFLDERFQLCSGLRGNDGAEKLSVLIQKQGGYQFDLLLLRQCRLIVNVDLSEDNLALVLLRCQLQCRFEAAAVATPWSRKLHQHGFCGLADILSVGMRIHI